MRKPIEMTEWLKDDIAQIEWTVKFLTEKKWLRSQAAGETKHARLLSQLKAIEQGKGLESKYILDQLKQSWRREKSRVKGTRVNYSFPLKPSIKKELGRLTSQTNGKHSNRVLEALIERGFDFEKEERKYRREELKKEIDAKRKELDKEFRGIDPKKQNVHLVEKVKLEKEVLELKSLLNKERSISDSRILLLNYFLDLLKKNNIEIDRKRLNEEPAIERQLPQEEKPLS